MSNLQSLPIGGAGAYGSTSQTPVEEVDIWEYFYSETPFQRDDGSYVDPMFLFEKYTQGKFAQCTEDVGEVECCPSGAPCWTPSQVRLIARRLAAANST